MTPRGRSGDDPAAGAPGGESDADPDADPDPDATGRAMRAVWLAMRDEEPPDRGLAELLAAARRKAEAMQPGPRRGRRVLAVMRRQPALAFAFAVAIVLIGGAVILGRRVFREQPAVMAARDSGHAAHDRRGDAAAAPPGPPGHGAPAAGATGAAATGEEPPAAGSSGQSSGKPAWGTEPAAPAREGAPPSSPLAQLYEACESAARRGDCPAVRRMVARITRTDRGYRARIAKGSAVARCLAE